MRFLVLVLCLAALCAAWVGFASGAKAASGIHPIIDAEIGCLLGGTTDGSWRSEREMKPKVRGGERYHLHSLTGNQGQAIGSKVTIDGPGDTHYVTLTPLPNKPEGVVGVCGEWNVLPRPVKQQSTSQKTYQDAIRAILKTRGLPTAPVGLAQVLRVDLQGDGKEEVLLSATTPKSGYPGVTRRKGDYSFVALRSIVNGKVQTSILKGEFCLKDEGFESGCPYEYRVLAVLDLDGDGVMEVLVRWRYYEGIGAAAYVVKGGKARQVFSGGSGA
jgi:hypothetical protein